MTRIDRIAEPWGGRTPDGPGERWPDRADRLMGREVIGSGSAHDVDPLVLTVDVRAPGTKPASRGWRRCRSSGPWAGSRTR
jgi:hypothetical protein